MKIKNRLPVFIITISILTLSAYLLFRNTKERQLYNAIAGYAGSESCKPCHERFYQLWAPSHHGLAMQPVTGDFIINELVGTSDVIRVGESAFEVSSLNDSLFFTETTYSGEKTIYPAIHAMGGKYIYYFLTEFERGRLHVLPLAYDCEDKIWYNNPESGVRHFETEEDSALDWKNHLYTFNTSCYNCHVSQLESNFDLNTLEYNTSWSEPGINCETCHGPSAEHIRVCVEAGEVAPEDLKIIITGDYTQNQHNSSCGSCHAKSSVIATGYKPGEEFFDYFDLIAFENNDFYADGRDLGENYTMSSWTMNKCKLSSELHCVNCHTSSGRYRFAGENPNMSCAPCHNDKISNVAIHSFHKEDSEGSVCIACHMPLTTFARMDRSDHSFRPPMPEATMAFGSPNACNICHKDKSPEWANESIKATHSRDYQSETVYAGNLIRDARNGEWENIDKILSGIKEKRFDDMFSVSFIRLLENYNNAKKWDAIITRTSDKSPFVRSAAAHSLYGNRSEEAFQVLMGLIQDEFRLVRMNAAFAISSFSEANNTDLNQPQVLDALSEYRSSLISRTDDWASHYNLGNFYSNTGDYQNALVSYQNSIRVFPEAIMPMINAGYILSLGGDDKSAEEMFMRALSYSPDHEAALLNLALLYGETGNTDEAISYYRRLLEVSKKNAVAAFNLSILLSQDKLDESIELIKNATEWDEGNIRYLYTYAYLLNLSGQAERAENILVLLIEQHPDFQDSYLLLTDIYIKSGKPAKARTLLNNALNSPTFPLEQKQGLLSILKSIED